jgi:hypothetical protein
MEKEALSGEVAVAGVKETEERTVPSTSIELRRMVGSPFMHGA